jgi:hypothetical protein
MWMTQITERADLAACLPRGASRVVCPACETACAVPAGAKLAEIACVACLAPLAEPALHGGARALKQVSTWCDRTRVPGPGYAMVACPHCNLACLVPIGVGLAATGCIGCLGLLGPGPLVRHDLHVLTGARDPWDEVRVLPCVAPPDLLAASL